MRVIVEERDEGGASVPVGRTAGTSVRRGRGRPPRVSRASIIDAARALGPGQLSVQAVADRLGVDRSTINYHFTDREELFTVLASTLLGAEMAAWVPPVDGDWREWVRAYAQAVHDALVRHSAVAVYVRLPLGTDVASLAPVEGLIQTLSASGFDGPTVAHAVALISETVHVTAQNEVLSQRGGHPQEGELVRYLDGQPERVAPGVRRLVQVDPLAAADHFAFALQVLVDGLEAALGRQTRTGSS